MHFQTARTTRPDRAMSPSIAKIDRYHSRTKRSHLAESGFANQRRSDKSNPGSVRLHRERNCSAGCLQRDRSIDDEAARLQRIRFAALGLLQQHAESDGEHRPRARRHLRRFYFCDPKFVEERLLAELHLFNQATRGPISGHPRSERQRARAARRSRQLVCSQ